MHLQLPEDQLTKATAIFELFTNPSFWIVTIVEVRTFAGTRHHGQVASLVKNGETSFRFTKAVGCLQLPVCLLDGHRSHRIPLLFQSCFCFLPEQTHCSSITQSIFQILCSPSLPTRTCCSHRTPYRRPTSPQSLFLGLALWASRKPARLSENFRLHKLGTSGGASGSSWSPQPMKLSPSAVLFPERKRDPDLFSPCLTIYTIGTASVDTSSATTSQVIDALSRCSSVVTTTKFSVLRNCWKKKQGK